MLAADEAVERRSLGEVVAERLREAIVAGSVRPGQRLRESELSARFQVSRSPIRDAFNRLSSEKLLTIRPHRGAVVASMPLRDMEEVYSLRLSLEGLAVRLAIERATGDDLSALRAVAAHQPGVATPETAREFAELDMTFHDLIYRAARHERLYSAWSLLRPHILRFLVWRNMVNADYREVYGSEHGELVDSLAVGDIGKATAMVADHLGGAYQRLVDAYHHQQELQHQPAGGARSSPLSGSPASDSRSAHEH